MPTRIMVNKLTVVHKDSGGMSTAFPDVCKTPTPGGPVPLPYPNVARSADTASGSQTVSADGNPMMLKSSYFSTSTGDEAGSAQGVASNKIKGKAYPKMYSFDVKVEGENVFRLSDIMLQNGGSPTNTPPAAEMQANLAGTGANAGKDPEQLEVTRIAFARQEVCCGDEVAISVRTKNAEDGDNVTLFLARTDDPAALFDSLDVRLDGNRAEPKWIIRRGKYAKQAKIRATQFLFKGQEKSSKDLLVKAPEPVARETKTYLKTVPKMTFDSSIGAWTPCGGNWEWDVSYEIELHPGELLVTRKLDFELKGGAKSPSTRTKRKWRREIESIWDKKWKIHRTKCKRGDKCDCPPQHGCCGFLVRVRCQFGAGPGKKVELHAGANHPKGLNNKWWYSHTWWEKFQNTPATVRPHEFGHLIGMYDEYSTPWVGAIDPSGLYANVKSSIMSAGSSTYKRHMKDFHDWFETKTKGIIGPSKLVRL